MPVTLGEDPGGAEDFSAGWKNGSLFHEPPAGGPGTGGGTGATGGAGVAATRDGLLKNCVKLPSDEAAGVEGPGAGEGVGAAGRGALLNNWVKLPSPEAESDAPGEEKPFERDGPDDGGAGRGASSWARDAGADGAAPDTKIRVKSPWPASDAGPCGAFTTCVATCGCSLAGGDAGR